MENKKPFHTVCLGDTSEKAYENVEVQVMVTCYNYGKYIADCLDGIFMQKCSFKYKVVVFDDASKDDSWEIIQTYQKKYSDRMIAYRPDQNTYQNGETNGGLIEIGLLPRTKYIAFCEGDDYWTSPDKLQKQYDAMEKHPECSICVCDVELYDVFNDRKIGMAPEGYKSSWSRDEIITRILTYQLSFRENSIFGRAETIYKENFSDKFWNYWACDLTKILHFLLHGDLLYIPENMTRKRVNNKGSISYTSNVGQDIIRWQIKEYEEDIAWIINFDEITNHNYSDMVNYYITFRKIKLYYLQKNELEKNRLVSNLNGKMYENKLLRKINKIYAQMVRNRYQDDECGFVKVSSKWMEKEWNRLQKKS